MKKSLLLIVTSFSFLLSSYACSCAGILPFCEAQSVNSTWSVFAGEIIRIDSNYIEFKVIHKFRGNDINDTLKIWDIPGDPNNSCIGPTNSKAKQLGNLGDSLLLLLEPIDSSLVSPSWGNITLGNVGDYIRPAEICSYPIMKISSDSIRGYLTGTRSLPEFKIIHLNDFINSYSPNGRALDCDLFVGLLKIKAESVQISPNPTSDLIRINLDNDEFSSTIRLFKSDGSLIMQKKAVNQEWINMSELPSGLYLLSVELKDGERIVKKIIKN